MTVICLAGSAAIHIAPLAGVQGASTLARLYEVEVRGPDLNVLLVHRAVLFGLLAAALIVSIFNRDIRPCAIGAVLASDVAFLLVSRLNPGLNDSMKRVVRLDVVSIVLLLGAVVAGIFT